MAASQWQRIEELFHATLLVEAPDRAAHLLRECGGDEVLRREVESLIAASQDEHSFIERPALSLGMQVISNGRTGSLVGQSIGHYKILRLLGAGGMGEVYLAEDCTLERQVALKFLAGGFVDDQWAKERLMAEARAVARLEDPNICQVYGIEEISGHNFIVMQYVEGETLDSLLRRGPLGLKLVLEFAEQIVSALAAAHLHGIIHRDVKPQNMIVVANRQIKVLDFGLAILIQHSQSVSIQNNSQDQATQLGFVVGTVAYMSPEQTQAEELDSRSDIFSFGIVLYQMLTARNPFRGEDNKDTVAAINALEPPPLADVPPDLKKIVSRCLQKKREERFETTAELLLAIRDLRDKRKRTELAGGFLHALLQPAYLRRYAVAAAASFILILVAASFIHSKVTKVHTLALVPIVNKSSDPAFDYLSQGLTRNLSDKFSYLPRLKVKLPTVMPSSQSEDIVRAGRELKVESILSGEIFRQGELLMLRLSMLSTADGHSTWEQTFIIDTANMFALQDEITRNVTAALDLWLVGDEKKLLAKRQTDNEDALRLYMKGRVHWGLKRDRENIQTAIKYFKMAIDLDPSFAQAHTGLADCYVLMTNVAYGPIPTKEAMDLARWHARQALDIDNSLAEAHTSMGVIKLKYDWDWQQAEHEFKSAIELDPEYAPAHYWYTNLLAVLGRFDESIKESEVARGLDPYSPLANMNCGRALYFARRSDEAAAHFRKLLEQQPDYPQYLHMMGLVLLQQQLYDDAISRFEKLYAIRPLHTAAALGYAYGKKGKPADAFRMIRALEEFAKKDPVPPHEKALVYIGLGDTNEAFKLLEESCQERFANLAYLTTDSVYDDLRRDSRFADLARRINLTP